MTGKKDSAARHRYRVYGLRLASDMELLGPTPVTDSGDADLRIAAADLQPPPDPEADSKWIEPQRARIYWAGVGQFEIEAGQQIRHRIHPDCVRNPGMFRQALLGPAMGLALQQRGLFPLHASALVHGGHALAILGRSGAGKSTLAHALQQAGCRLLTDDIAALRRDGSETFAEPGLGSLRLWPTSLAGSDLAGDLPRLHLETDKRLLQAREPATKAVPLRVMLVLDEGEELALEALAPSVALVETCRNIYYPELTNDGGQGAANWQRAAALLEGLAVYRLRRPRDLALLPETCRAVLSLLG